MRLSLIPILLLMLLLGACGDAGEPGATPPPAGDGDARTYAEAYDAGLEFLLSPACEQFLKDPAMRSFAVTAFILRPGGAREGDAGFVKDSLDYVSGFQKENGGIYIDKVANYSTCAAVLALTATGDEGYRPVIDKAIGFVKTLQTDSGGIGYSDKNPGEADLSNTQFALEAMRNAGVPVDEPVYSKALEYLQSVQNRSESNNVEYELEDGRIVVALDDGGAFYKPGESKAGMETRPDGKVGLKSYGSMTYALLKCYLIAGLDARDPRVAAAVDWISTHFTLDENPGFDAVKDPPAGMQGYYSYLFTMAKALDLLDVEKVKDADGIEHDWRKELRTKLLSLQREDGSWINDGNERWWEAYPPLATSYALAALSYCAP